MRERCIDLWSPELDGSVRCITTNGTVESNGVNVMGAGCAGEASRRFRTLPLVYGRLLQASGNHVYLIPPPLTREVSRPLVMFPVKHQVWEDADLGLLQRSLTELMILTDLYGWKDVSLPQPGCGHGGLDYIADVRPLLEANLDDRFTIIDYPK